MKIKKFIISIIITVLLIAIQGIFISNNAYAAVAINGGKKWVNITANNAFNLCLQMKNGSTSTLGTNKLDPHMTTSSDWGIIAYLGASDYGYQRTALGSQITLTPVSLDNSSLTGNGPSTLDAEGKIFYTTTGNASGVMDFGGSEYTFTATLLESYTGSYANISVIKSYSDENSKYVEKLSATNSSATTRGQAYAEVASFPANNRNYPHSASPLGLRCYGAFGYFNGTGGSAGLGQGNSSNSAGFRPAIWNIDTTK